MTIVAVSAAGAAHADPPSASSTQVQASWQRLELTFPFLKPLRFSFNDTPVPGFEPLSLPTFRAESVWWERGPLSLRSFSEVAPALDLDCSSTCQPTLARSLGAEGHLELGGISRAIPATNIFFRGQNTQVVPAVPGAPVAPRSFKLLSAGVSGLLDF